MGFLNDIAKADNVGKEDIIHRAMIFQIGLLPIILGWSIIIETLFAFGYVKQFDMAAVLSAVMSYEIAVSALLAGGTVSMFFRKTANSDGSTSESEDVTKGKQPDIINNTVVQNG